MKIFAHRGASKEAPENSLEAFRKAVEIGVDGIELDCLLTKDRVPIVTHYNDLSILKLGKGSLFEKTWAEVRDLGIPNLTQVLEQIKPTETEVVFDIKAQPGLMTEGPMIVAGLAAEILPPSQILLSSFPGPVAAFLNNYATNIKFSPDETKVLYEATASASLNEVITPPLIGSNPTIQSRTIAPDNWYIYDKKEDKNYNLADVRMFPDPTSLIWYTDSKHIIMIEKDIIYITDYDGTNKKAIYGGPFEDHLVFPWPQGGKLIIMTNLNKLHATPNLYAIDLR